MLADPTPFEYPQHLRDAIGDLPNAPGVYVFHGEEGDLPLYIGKSVQLRNRVLSHLRNADEARLLRQARRISHIRTAGEVGALLLEAQLIKQRQPLLNKKLRRNRQLCSLRLTNGVPDVVYADELDFATTPGLFGLYASRHAALDALRAMADANGLCWGALKLEKLSPGKACFRHMVKLCAGVCCGKESAADHHARLMASLHALQLVCWPHPGAIGLVEEHRDDTLTPPVLRQIHVVRNWCYLGSAETLQAARRLNTVAAGFDGDGYKILCKPVLSGTLEIVALG
jgi:excinuclease Cho